MKSWKSAALASLLVLTVLPIPSSAQTDRGTITGTANPTPGYRGMHSFTLAFDRYFVPADNLVGGESGLGKGFYLQMGGFAAGRLQTGGRATGVAQAALEKACNYASDGASRRPCDPAFGFPTGGGERE